MNTIAKVEQYHKTETLNDTTICLRGTRENSEHNIWEAWISIIKRNEISSNELLNMISESDEECSHFYVNDKIYKIYVQFSHTMHITEGVQAWSDNVNYSILGIPPIIWCNLVGQITSKL